MADCSDKPDVQLVPRNNCGTFFQMSFEAFCLVLLSVINYEKRKKLFGFSFSINMANFETFCKVFLSLTNNGTVLNQVSNMFEVRAIRFLWNFFSINMFSKLLFEKKWKNMFWKFFPKLHIKSTNNRKSRFNRDRPTQF